MFKKIKGQDRAIATLKKAVKEDKLSHSYLFYGPEGVGKLTTGFYFAMAINCLDEEENRPCGKCSSCQKISNFNHPDVLYLFPTPNYDISPNGEIKDAKLLSEYESYITNKKNTPWKDFYFKGNTEIRMDCIKMLQHRINLSANEGRFKIFIIEKADQINVNAANSFLKTLEEPPNDVVIILTSAKREAMLPTILSRCQKIPFYSTPRKLIEEELFFLSGQESPEIKIVSRIANGSLEKALNVFYSQRSEAREKMKELVHLIIKSDDIGFISFAEAYKSNKTLSELTDILQYIILWLGDLLLYNDAPQEIVNIDDVDTIRFVVENNPLIIDYAYDLVLFMENMIKRLEGNVNPHLVTIEVFNRLKNCLAG